MYGLGMRKGVKDRLMKCGACQLHKAQPEHFQYGRMPMPKYLYQYMPIDLVGPFTRSECRHS